MKMIANMKCTGCHWNVDRIDVSSREEALSLGTGYHDRSGTKALCRGRNIIITSFHPKEERKTSS